MLDFRKVFYTFAAAALMTGAANAQVLLDSAGIGVTPGYAALESTTALLPQLTISFTGSATGTVTFQLTANVPFTNVTQPMSTNLDPIAVDNAGTPDSASTISQPSPTVMQFTFNSVANTATEFIITGLRVNASLVGNSSAITVVASGLPGGGFSTSGGATSPTTVAYVVKSLAAPSLTSVANTSMCGISTTAAENVVSATITEGFPGAFLTATQNSSAGSVAATQDTRIAVTFNNLNSAGVNYYVPAAITNGTLTVKAYAGAVGGAALTGVTTPASVAGDVLLTVSGGSATIYYDAGTSSVAGTESFTIPVTEVIPTPSAVTSFSTTPVSISVTLAGVATGYPQFSTSQTAYTATQTGMPPTQGLLTACSTTIVFPYIVNVQGYDTGIAIVNASTLPSGSGVTVTPSSGTCTVTFYGSNAPTATYSTGLINSGANAAFDVGTQASGIDGYAVAVCNFQGAHGYAYITSGSGGTADYLGVVVNESGLTAPSVVF